MLLEGGLRIFGIAPSGYFNFLLPSETGLYPPSQSIYNYWGLIPYKVETNALGLRGPSAEANKKPGTYRIAGIGDSMIDGFFVDNDGTFLHHLRQLLQLNHPGTFEVLNCARGGASIDKELAILREVVLPLDPDLVLLGFVTNDIFEIAGKDTSALLHSPLSFHPQGMSRKRRLFTRAVTKTAIGEFGVKLYWKAFVLKRQAQVFGQDRYDIEGGDRFEENAAEFHRRFDCCDGLILKESFSAETEKLVSNYLIALDTFIAECNANETSLALLYFPSYSQIYEAAPPMRIRDILSDHCKKNKVNFIDLTAGLKEKGKGKVLHLAPIDFHFNPDGNAASARILYDSLTTARHLPHLPFQSSPPPQLHPQADPH